LTLSLRLTEFSGHATKLASEAAKDGVETLVVMGGDGTVREAVNGLANSNSAMGIVAVGTGNDLARSLGLPIHQPAQALRIAGTGVRMKIDLGLMGDRYFASVLGVGFPAAVAVEANKIRKIRGPAVFLIAMYKALFRMKAVPMKVILDDRRIEGRLTSVVIQNTQYTGGGLLIAPEASLEDGRLDVIAVDDIGRMRLMLNLPKLYVGRHVTHRNFTLTQSERVQINSEEKLPAMCDGDLCGYTPLSVSTARKALSVIVKD
jgi:diacylglycerol kinase (ATP)